MSTRTYRGLELDDPDVTTPEELERFFGYADQPMGRPIPSYEMWANLRPDVLKRTLSYVALIHEHETFPTPLPFMNIYAIGGWSEGVSYIMKLCEPGTFLSGPGYSKAAVVETLALAFYLAPTWGTVLVADTVTELLREYREPPVGAPSPFPEGWAVDPDALKAGLDYSVPELTTRDRTNLFEWYERITGEVPASAQMYAKYRPELLKAGRYRWETLIRDGLPNQMLAYLTLHYEVFRINPAGAREALLLAKGLGVAKHHAVDAIAYGGVFFGGTGTLAAVDEALGDILDAW